MDNYKHLVEVDERSRRVAIYRVYASGDKELYTAVDLPVQTIGKEKSEFEQFARLLGENILLDSPAARRVLSL